MKHRIATSENLLAPISMAYSRGFPQRHPILWRVQPDLMPLCGKVGRYTNKMHYIKKYFLRELKRQQFAVHFMEPVDMELLNVPTYYTVIKRPMDFGTIIKRLDNRYYQTVDELIDDIKLVIHNCYTFNRPNAHIYRNCQMLETFLQNVLAKLPYGEEVLSTKGKSERSVCKHQCNQRLQNLEDDTVQLEPDAQHFFHKNWLALGEELSENNIDSLDNFDTKLASLLKQCQDQANSIQKTFFQRNVEDAMDTLANGNKAEEPEKQCFKPEFNWEDSLIDALDNTSICLKKDMVRARLHYRTDKQTYSKILLPMFVNAQVINEEHCSQTNLSDSDEEAEDSQQHFASEEERLTIQQRYNELSPKSKIAIIHMIEQSDIRFPSNSEQKYNILFFKPETVRLIRKAIDDEVCVETTEVGYSTTMPQMVNASNEAKEECSEQQQQELSSNDFPCSFIDYAEECEQEVDATDYPWVPGDEGSEESDDERSEQLQQAVTPIKNSCSPLGDAQQRSDSLPGGIKDRGNICANEVSSTTNEIDGKNPNETYNNGCIKDNLSK